MPTFNVICRDRRIREIEVTVEADDHDAAQDLVRDEILCGPFWELDPRVRVTQWQDDDADFEVEQVGETPNENEDRYAMHYGIALRSLTPAELEQARQAVKPFGGDAYQDGDNAFEWGELIMSAEEAADYGRNQISPIEQVRAQSAHFVVYINKGISPEVVHERITEALPFVKFLPVEPQWSFRVGLPFSVDEAEEWGKNVHTAWEAQA